MFKVVMVKKNIKRMSLNMFGLFKSLKGKKKKRKVSTHAV